MKKSILKPVLFLLIVAGQLAVLGSIIFQREQLLEHGTLIRLECEPVDPRSLLSGDYVILNYKISRFNETEIDKLVRGDVEFRHGDPVWVALEKSEKTGFHEATAIAADRTPLGGAGLVIRGKILSAWSSGMEIRYGLEQYFVPQKQGLEIERSIRDTTVEVAVDAGGKSAVKQLFISGVAVKFH